VGHFVNQLIRGFPLTALSVAEQMSEVSKEDRAMQLIAHTAMMDVRYWLGDLIMAEEQYLAALALYREDEDFDQLRTYGFDMKAVNYVHASQFYWMRGYPDKALRIKRELDQWCKQLNNPFMLAFAASFGSSVLQFRHDYQEQAQQLEKGLLLSRQMGFGHFLPQAEFMLGWNRVMQGHITEANLQMISDGVAGFASTGSGVSLRYLQMTKVEAYLMAGDLTSAMQFDAQCQTEQRGYETKVYDAEILNIRAQLRLKTRGEAAYCEAEELLCQAIEIARKQRARSWELRASIHYARLMKDQDRRREALQLLQPIYDWFTEGRSTKDHTEAKALLDELRASIRAA